MLNFVSVPSFGKGIAFACAVIVGLGTLFFVGPRFFRPAKPRITQAPVTEKSLSSSENKGTENEEKSENNVSPEPNNKFLTRSTSNYGQSPDSLSPPTTPQETQPPEKTPEKKAVASTISEQEENEQGISYTIKLVSPTTTASSSSSAADQTFYDWQSAVHYINEADEDIDSVSIKFPSALITEYHAAIQFKKWISRLNDYIFLLRIVEIKDLSKVIRNPQLVRGSLADHKNRGCALFDVEKHNWVIQLKGLDESTKHFVAIIEEIIQPALNEPDNIATCSALPCLKISQLIKGINKDITDNQGQSADTFIKMCTTDKSMRQQNDDNLGAFIPCVAWHELNDVEEGQIQKIETDKREFLQFFSDVVAKNIPNQKSSNDIVNQFNQSHYKTVMGKFKKFVTNCGVANAVKRSLFKVPPKINKDT